MTKEGIDLEVWYCSDESIRGKIDRGFGAEVKWDIPLLEGYNYRFFKNYSWTPSIYAGFWGLMNFGLLRALLKKKKKIVLIHGWSSFIAVFSIIIAKLVGHKIWLRSESPLNQELSKSYLNRLMKRIFLQTGLFLFVDKFLYIGSQNKAFYEYYHVKERKLIFAPYSVDNHRFMAAAKKLLPRKTDVRKEFGFPADAKIILYSGKYIPKKRPMDLLEAYRLLTQQQTNKHFNSNDFSLVMVGDGELRPQMEQFISENQLKNIFLTGFINQSEIVKFYAIADVFVMCSGHGETWGLSVNESMNFNLPVVVSDTTGCASDLVAENINGYIHKTADPGDLMMKIEKALILYQNNSLEIIQKFSFSEIIKSIKSEIAA